jgi:hypothetical protein
VLVGRWHVISDGASSRARVPTVGWCAGRRLTRKMEPPRRQRASQASDTGRLAPRLRRDVRFAGTRRSQRRERFGPRRYFDERQTWSYQSRRRCDSFARLGLRWNCRTGRCIRLWSLGAGSRRTLRTLVCRSLGSRCRPCAFADLEGDCCAMACALASWTLTDFDGAAFFPGR